MGDQEQVPGKAAGHVGSRDRGNRIHRVTRGGRAPARWPRCPDPGARSTAHRAGPRPSRGECVGGPGRHDRPGCRRRRREGVRRRHPRRGRSGSGGGHRAHDHSQCGWRAHRHLGCARGRVGPGALHLDHHRPSADRRGGHHPREPAGGAALDLWLVQKRCGARGEAVAERGRSRHELHNRRGLRAHVTASRRKLRGRARCARDLHVGAARRPRRRRCAGSRHDAGARR